MTSLNESPNPAHRRTELVCRCGNRWVAKTKVTSLGYRMYRTTTFSRLRGAYTYDVKHVPSWCPRCGKEYVGIGGPVDGDGKAKRDDT